MPSEEISKEGRRSRFEQWEKLGLDRVKADLLDGGHQIIGGPPAVRELAWEWVRQKEHEEVKPIPDEIIQLKPAFYGVGIDLKALGRRIEAWWRKLFGGDEPTC